MRDGFVFYRSFYEAVLDAEDEATQARIFKAICEYALNDIEPEEKGVVSIAFRLVKPQIDANNQRYENGKKGGRPKNQTETKPKPNQNQTITEAKPKEKEKEKEKVKDKEKEKVKVKDKYIEIIENAPIEMRNTLLDFIEHRKNLKKPLTPRALELIISKSQKLSNGNLEDAIAIIEQSIENGWQGVFELKSKSQKSGRLDWLDSIPPPNEVI